MSKFIAINITGIKDAKNKYQKVEKRIEREYERELLRTQTGIYNQWRKGLRKHKNAGYAARKQVVMGNYLVGSNWPGLLWLDVGTKEHEISATKAPMLHFLWLKIGEWRRTKKVSHPGQKANNYLLNAYIDWVIPFKQKLGKRIEDRIKRLK